MRRNDALFITLAAILIAVTAVFTIVARVPIPGTTGYINLSDVVIYFTAYAFGPLLGAVVGGVGPAIADLLGYPQFAWLSLLAHGSQGLVAGWLGRGKGLPGLIVAWLAGALCMVTIYFLGEGLVLTTWPMALAELPFNLVQVTIGGLVGIPLFYAVRKAYPPLLRMGQPPTWHEE